MGTNWPGELEGCTIYEKATRRENNFFNYVYNSFFQSLIIAILYTFLFTDNLAAPVLMLKRQFARNVKAYYL